MAIFAASTKKVFTDKEILLLHHSRAKCTYNETGIPALHIVQLYYTNQQKNRVPCVVVRRRLARTCAADCFDVFGGEGGGMEKRV